MAIAQYPIHAVLPREPITGTKRFHGRLKIDAQFCPTDVEDLFTTVDWEVRSAPDQGRERRADLRADQLRSAVVLEPAGDERHLQQILLRRSRHARARIQRASSSCTAWPARSPIGASKTATSPSPQDGERFYRDLAWLCLHQHGAFNSPVWFNVGLYHQYGVNGAKCNWRWDPRDAATSCSRRTRTSIRRAARASSSTWPTTWKTSWSSPAARPCSSSSAAAPAPTSPRSARIARSSPAAASPAARSRSCASTTRSRPS